MERNCPVIVAQVPQSLRGVWRPRGGGSAHCCGAGETTLRNEFQIENERDLFHMKRGK